MANSEKPAICATDTSNDPLEPLSFVASSILAPDSNSSKASCDENEEQDQGSQTALHGLLHELITQVPASGNIPS